MPQGSYLTVSNPRTGSSYLANGLNELPGVSVDYEVKWKPGYEPHPIHMVMSDDSWDCKTALTAIDENAKITGSKLVFDTLPPIQREDVPQIVSRIDPEIPLVHIIRSYFDIILSLEARGAINAMNRPPSESTRNTMMFKTLTKETDHVDINELERGRKGQRDLETLRGMAINLFQNDLICLALCEHARHSMRVSYDELSDRLSDIAHFIGYDGDAAAIEHIRQNPITRKLKPLSHDLLPESANLRTFCDLLYSKLQFILEMQMPYGEIWQEDGRLVVPGLSGPAG